MKPPFDENLIQAIVEEARRRDLVSTVTCKHCGEIFWKQKLEYILAHTVVCGGRNPEVKKDD